jgi:hypothetical protein
MGGTSVAGVEGRTPQGAAAYMARRGLHAGQAPGGDSPVSGRTRRASPAAPSPRAPHLAVHARRLQPQLVVVQRVARRDAATVGHNVHAGRAPERELALPERQHRQRHDDERGRRGLEVVQQPREVRRDGRRLAAARLVCEDAARTPRPHATQPAQRRQLVRHQRCAAHAVRLRRQLRCAGLRCGGLGRGRRGLCRRARALERAPLALPELQVQRQALGLHQRGAALGLPGAGVVALAPPLDEHLPAGGAQRGAARHQALGHGPLGLWGGVVGAEGAREGQGQRVRRGIRGG